MSISGGGGTFLVPGATVMAAAPRIRRHPPIPVLLDTPSPESSQCGNTVSLAQRRTQAVQSSLWLRPRHSMSKSPWHPLHPPP